MLDSVDGIEKTETSKVALCCGAGGLGLAIESVLVRDGLLCARVAASEMLQDLGHRPPDLLIFDADGPADLAVCDQVRRLDGFERVRLLVLYPTDRTIDRRRAEACGADVFLAKPFAMNDLRDRVAKALDRTAPEG